MAFFKYFFPNTCLRYSFHVGLEQLDSYTFFNQMQDVEYSRNVFYLTLTGLTTLIGIPVSIFECSNTDMNTSLYKIGGVFMDTNLMLLKIFVYLDTAFSFAL